VFADHFGLGDPAQLLVTTGSQQGLDLVAQVLLDPGDEVIVSDPEYLGMLQVLRSHGAQPVPIPSDGDGLDVEALAARLAAGLRPKVCYLVPHFHNPSGATLNVDRRAELHRLSSHYGFVVIEDDPYRELYHDDSPAPADVAVDPEWTVRLRTASKCLAPGLRVAAIHAPPMVHAAMVIAKQSADLHTSTLNQAIVSRALGAPWFAGHLDRLRRSYQHKCDTLIDALLATFGDSIRLVRPTGGMFLWVDMARLGNGDGSLDAAPLDSGAWLARSLEHGVCFVPGTAFAVERDLRSYARFSFATASAEELQEAVVRLASAVAVRPG
jgi:2-aminoadipate transaminase